MKTPELSACHELEALLPAYVERSLPAAEAERVAAHLATCPTCQLQVTQLRALSDDLDAALPLQPLDQAHVRRPEHAAQPDDPEPHAHVALRAVS